jgi:cell division protein FtsA
MLVSQGIISKVCRHAGDIVRHDTNEEITQREIDQLIADQYKTYIPAGDQIIDVIPQEFTVDNFSEYPLTRLDMDGVKVGANFHIITGDKNAIRNINRAVEKMACIQKTSYCSHLLQQVR